MRGPPPDRRALGAAAEEAATAFLSAQGLTILERNYRCRMGELDVIALLAPDVLDLKPDGEGYAIDWIRGAFEG